MVSPSTSRAWWLLGVAAVGGLAYARRTRGYDLIASDLRSPVWRLRSPSLGPLTLPLLRATTGPTSCVGGVALEATGIASKDGGRIVVYVYRPGSARPGGPAMLYTHGGGMVGGSASSCHAVLSSYARDLGIVVVSTEYRLAPEHPFPTPLDDVHSAYSWLRERASALGVDPRRIAVGGESAGGGLTAALCQRLQDLDEPAPAFQSLAYPMLDDRTALRPVPGHRGQLVWTPASNLFGWSSYLGRAPAWEAAPEGAAPGRRAELAGLPPAWIGVGTLDLFFDEDVDYATRLSDAGVPCEVEVVRGAFHGFDRLSDAQVARSFRGALLGAVRRGLGIPLPEA